MWQTSCTRAAQQQQCYRDSAQHNQKFLENHQTFINKLRDEDNYRMGVNLTDSQRIQRDEQIKANEEKKKKQQEEDIWWAKLQNSHQKKVKECQSIEYAKNQERKRIEDAKNQERLKQDLLIRQQQQKQEKNKLDDTKTNECCSTCNIL